MKSREKQETNNKRFFNLLEIKKSEILVEYEKFTSELVFKILNGQMGLINTRQTDKKIDELYRRIFAIMLATFNEAIDQQEAEWGFELESRKKLIEMRINKLNYLDRLERSKEELKKRLRASLTKNQLIDNDEKTARQLKILLNDAREIIGGNMNKPFLILNAESQRIINIAKLEFADEYQTKTGKKLKKIWVTMNDEAVRSDHQELQGKVVELNDLFEVTGDSAAAPGMFTKAENNVNCRCYIIIFE